MKFLKDIIQEKLIINKNIKPIKKNNDKFEEDRIDEYVEAINLEIDSLGYKAINKNNRAIWVFPLHPLPRVMGLKNLVCAIQSKTFIDWGPNEKLKPKLEEPILNAIQKVK